MRAEELFTVEGTGKEAFTEMARVVESIRLGTTLPNGRCLRDELTAFEKEEVETYVLKKLMPEIKAASKAKSRKVELSYEREALFHELLVVKVYEEFHKYNKAKHLVEDDKTYEISSFIETQARAAFRDFLVEERGLPRHTIENMGFVSSAVADIVMDQGISLKEVTSDMVYEKMGKEKLISKKMIDILLDLLKGSSSIEDMTEREMSRLKCDAELIDQVSMDMDSQTKAKLDAVFATFSDLELFILMKEFGFLGKEIGSMTVREISYQDYFVDMVRKEKLGAKNIEFGSVKVARPGRNCGAEDVLLVENVFYVKERYYNNKVAKIRKKLASLATTVDKDDLLGCLDGYCRKLWHERGFMS